jgi:serine/threonine-protein kinase
LTDEKCHRFELLAVGLGARHQWRKMLPRDEVVRLGRSPKSGWAVPWDMRISREHADLMLAGDQLHVRCLGTARNAIHRAEHRTRDLVIGLHDEFRIGDTRFCLLRAGEHPDRPVASAHVGPRTTPLEFGGSPTVQRGGAPGQLSPGEANIPDRERDEGAGPRRLGGYLLVERIHQGVWADIYMARHEFLDRWAAVQRQVADDELGVEAAARLQLKAKLLAWFQHPQLPVCFDADDSQGVVYVAMQWIDGHTLASHIQKQELTLTRAIDCICQAAEGLAHAHHYGVVHGQIDPSHLMLDQHDCVKIIGWNRAQRLGHESLPGIGSVAETIGPGVCEPPERKRAADPRSDIRGLGWTLFSLLTRQPCLPMDDDAGPAAASDAARGRTIREYRSDVPLSVQEVFQTMVAGSQEDGFKSMSEVLGALDSFDRSERG